MQALFLLPSDTSRPTAPATNSKLSFLTPSPSRIEYPIPTSQWNSSVRLATTISDVNPERRTERISSPSSTPPSEAGSIRKGGVRINAPSGPEPPITGPDTRVLLSAER